MLDADLDGVAVLAYSPGQLDKGGDAAAPRPGQPPGQRASTTLMIQSAPSVDTWVICALRSGPSASKNAFTVFLSRPGAAHTSRPVSWSTTHVMYRWPRL